MQDKIQGIDCDFLLLQLNDSLFPIGSFQHSFGLETYVQYEHIVSTKDMQQFMSDYLQSVFLYNDLLACKLCFESIRKDSTNIDSILEIESVLFASNTANEVREANHKLGLRFIKATHSLAFLTMPTYWFEYIKQSKQPTHATSYSVFCAFLGLEYSKVIKSYLYAFSANMIVNAVKLIPLSQDDGIEILSSLNPIFCKVLERLENLRDSYLGCGSPYYDIHAIEHKNLYSRLYMS